MAIPARLLFVILLIPLNLTITKAASNITFLQNAISSNSCWQFVESTGGRIYSHASRGRYANKLDCKVTIKAPPGNRIVIKIENFDITDSLNCYQDEVIFYDGRRNSSPQLSGSLYGLCGSSVPEEYRHMVSSGNEVTVRFITDGVPTDNTGFVLSYTAFIPTSRKNEGDNCFQCFEDPMCIDPQLECDGLANCIDGSDESMEICYDGYHTPDEPTESSYGWLSWPGTLFAFVFVSCYIISIVVNCAVCCHKASPRPYNNARQEVVITPSKISRHNEPSLCQVMSSNVHDVLAVQIENEDLQFDKHSNRGHTSRNSKISEAFTMPSSPRGRGDGSFGRTFIDEQGNNYIRPVLPNLPHGSTKSNAPQTYAEQFQGGRYSGQWSSSSSHHVVAVAQNYN